jgi:hypothetical protein
VRTAVEVLAALGSRVGDTPALTPPSRWLAWAEVFGADVAEDTLRAHRLALELPGDLVGTLVAGRVAGALGRVQAWSLALTGCALEVAPAELHLGVEHGEVLGVVDLSRARVVGPRQAGPSAEEPAAAAGMCMDATIRELVDVCSVATGFRVPARVVASAAVFAWYAALREIPRLLDGRPPADVLREQWRSAWALDTLVRPIAIADGPEARTYLARSACCLEYRCDPPGARSYCTSCPMVDPDLARDRLESGTTSGGRRPFGPDALRGPRRAVAS